MVVAAAVVFFYPAPFCGHTQHGHLRSFAKLIATGQTIFAASRKWFSPPFLLGSTKRFAIFDQQKNQQGGLDKRGNLAYNHGILLLRSAPLLILLLVLTRLSLSGVRGRAVLSRRWFHVPDIRAGDITVRPSQHPPCPPCALSYHVPCAPDASGVLLLR